MRIAHRHRLMAVARDATRRRISGLLHESFGELVISYRSTVEFDRRRRRGSESVDVEADERREAAGVRQIALPERPAGFAKLSMPITPRAGLEQPPVHRVELWSQRRSEIRLAPYQGVVSEPRVDEVVAGCEVGALPLRLIEALPCAFSARVTRR